MLHYARCMKIIGPLIHIWTMRFEAKHRPLKQSALISNNRINIPYTVAMKQQLHLATLFLENIFQSAVTYKKLNNSNERPIAQLSDIDLSTYYQIQYFVINNIKYDINTTIKLSCSDMPTYGRISNIFKDKNSNNTSTNFAFIVKVLKCIKRDDHFQSYQLTDTKKYNFILYQSLLHFEPRNEVRLANGMTYVFYDNHMF